MIDEDNLSTQKILGLDIPYLVRLRGSLELLPSHLALHINSLRLQLGLGVNILRV